MIIPMDLRQTFAACTLLIAIASPFAANADFTVCNQNERQVAVSVAFRDGNMWTSNGWWVVEPGACDVVIRGDLAQTRYYLYATELETGGLWEGPNTFCTAPTSFAISGRLDCRERGYEETGFFEIDTKGAVNWQQDLGPSDPASD